MPRKRENGGVKKWRCEEMERRKKGVYVGGFF